MKLSVSLSEIGLAAVVVGGLGIAAWQFFGNDSGPETVSVKVPKLTAQAAAGRAAFDTNCAQCHGTNGSGTKLGPPLVHDIYNPGHHADEAFQRAVRQGVQQHHWPYGNMPPAPQVTDSQLADIVRYVRELQQANGIFYRPHQM
jgi:mono/diheme cytochrome c family protein